MSYSKHKDALPEDSIARARNVCSTVGINVSVEVKKRLDGVYSAILTDQDCGWVTCGKGTTEKFCVASAFGEAIEHMSNYFAYNMSGLSAQAEGSYGFYRYPDEQLLPIDDIPRIAPDAMEDMRRAYYQASEENISDTALCEFIKRVFGSDMTVFVPYYSLRHQENVLLPELLIANLCGSNGGGAGNSPEEAIGHGLDEIAERFVKYRIYHEHLTPPTVPAEYIAQRCPELARTIHQIESLGKLRVVVKDASLGCGFPVVGVFVVDYEQQKYLANFGSHPCFEIALERCLTEMFQFYEIGGTSTRRKEMNKWVAVPDEILDSVKNWVSLLKDDVGFLPDSLFAGEPAWEFKPWPETADYTNLEGMNQQIERLATLAPDFYIRNNSYLGFEAYRVYIPGVSTTHLPFDESHLRCTELCDWLMKKLREQTAFTKVELEDICENVFHPRMFVNTIIFHNMPESISYALYAALMYVLGREDEAISLLNMQDDWRCRAAVKALQLKSAGTSHAQIEELVKLFYDEEAAEFALSWCKEGIFESLMRRYGKNNFPVQPKHGTPKGNGSTDRLHMRIKAEMLRHTVDQTAVAQFIRMCRYPGCCDEGAM